jgi:hypothetical protein
MGIMGNFLVSNFSLDVVTESPKNRYQLSAVSFQLFFSRLFIWLLKADG